MIEYDELPISILEQLEEIALEDIYGTFEAQSVYSEISLSTKKNTDLASLYEVPIELVQEIKEINILADKKDFILSIYENNQEIVMNIITSIIDKEIADLSIYRTLDTIEAEDLNTIFTSLEKINKS